MGRNVSIVDLERTTTIIRFIHLIRLNKAPFCHLLPQVSSSPSIAGRLVSAWMGVAAGTPVGVAMGDNQCSVKAACHSEESCAGLLEIIFV